MQIARHRYNSYLSMHTLALLVVAGHRYLADKHGRSPLIAAGGVLSIVAAVVTAYVVWVAAEEDASGAGPPRWAMITLAGCMVAWGISGGIVSGPAQALYADSIPHGERSKWCTTRRTSTLHFALFLARRLWRP